MKPTGPTDENVRKLIIEMKKLANKESSKFWKDLALRIGKPRRNKRGVNLSTITKYLNDGEIAVVPYKILGYGEAKQGMVVASLMWSKSAKEKVESAGGRVISLNELMMENPKGKNVRIFE